MLIQRGTMDTAAIVVHANEALGVSQKAFGELLGVSRRTVTRWVVGRAPLSERQTRELVRLVYPRDAELAARIAECVGETLVSLGIVAPPPVAAPAPAPLPTSHLVDGVVCAAAEAMDVSPRALRPALWAALKRAREIGMTLEELEGALRPPTPP